MIHVNTKLNLRWKFGCHKVPIRARAAKAGDAWIVCRPTSGITQLYSALMSPCPELHRYRNNETKSRHRGGCTDKYALQSQVEPEGQ